MINKAVHDGTNEQTLVGRILRPLSGGEDIWTFPLFRVRMRVRNVGYSRDSFLLGLCPKRKMCGTSGKMKLRWM